MWTVEQALEAIQRTVRPAAPCAVELDAALGLVLAEEIASDCDSPPFDKALMDGYCVRAADCGRHEVFDVIEEIGAGRTPERALLAGQATRLMTGAPLPVGGDAVVPVEETEAVGPTGVRLLKPVTAEQHLLRRGAAARQGELILSPGRRLRAQEIAVLAEVGRSRVQAQRRPRVGILTTGNELVPAGTPLGPGQIRNSNAPMLAAQMRQMGADAVELGIARDVETELRSGIERGLTSCDLLLLSGGVSAGKFDLVPGALRACGVREVFHKLQMKPGKPLWFGVWEGSAGEGRCGVFGLPGNPVSSMVCAELFVRTAVRRFLGLEPAVLPGRSARLAHEFNLRGNRPTYHPAWCELTPSGWAVHVVDWIGSADLRATVDANCMALFPTGDRTYAAGDMLEIWDW